MDTPTLLICRDVPLAQALCTQLLTVVRFPFVQTANFLLNACIVDLFNHLIYPLHILTNKQQEHFGFGDAYHCAEPLIA